jgi:hypothetical protein
MQRRAFLLGGLAMLKSPSLLDLFTSMAQALSAGSPSEFLAPFQRSMPGYRQLESQVFALLNQAEVASSVELVQDQGDDQRHQVELDWILEIRSNLPDGPSERRRQLLKVTLTRRGKNWRIVSLDPLDFFAPLANRQQSNRQ